jgi:hypothetical protein
VPVGGSYVLLYPLCADTLFFASAGLLSPLVDYVTATAAQESYVYSGIAALAALIVIALTDALLPWTSEEDMVSPSLNTTRLPRPLK